MSTKTQKRIERKKKKLAALREVTELNDKDRNEIELKHLYGQGDDCCNVIVLSDPNNLIKENREMGSKSCPYERAQGYCFNNGEETEDKRLLHEKSDDVDTNGCGRHYNHKSKKKIKHDNQEPHQKFLKPDNVEKEWPLLGSDHKLVDSQTQKRKSSNSTFDDQKECPVKIIKCHSSYSNSPSTRQSTSEFNFIQELANLQKDVERKKKREKRSEEKAKNRLASNNESAPKSSHRFNTSSNEMVPNDTFAYENEMAELRKLMNQRKKQLKELPVVKLKGVGKEADLNQSNRTPILPGDVQNLFLIAQLGHDTPRFPRWIELKKYSRLSKTAVLVVEGVSAYDLYSRESQCPTLSAMDVKVEMVSPYCYNASIAEELCAVPITRQQKKELERRFGKEICPEALVTDRIIKVLRSAFSISSLSKTCPEEVEQKIAVPSTDKFARTELLLSAWQMIEEGYPLPLGSKELGNRYPDYVMSKDEYKEVTPTSPMWAIDCEMCLTRAGNELTRVSVVDEQHKTVYESLCLPPNPIKDYLTEYSGITAQMLKGVTTKLHHIQEDLRRLFPPDIILVGQSLSGDLHALKMMHPYIIDTSVIFNLTGNRRHKSKLSKLAMEFLNEAIQQRGAEGHDSFEDSLAALKLVQLKLTKNIAYGDAVLSGLDEQSGGGGPKTNSSPNISYPEHSAEEFQDLQLDVGPVMASSLFKHFTMRKKTVAVIGQEETLTDYCAFVAAAHRESKQLVKTHTTTSNWETINVAAHECKSNNFTYAHVVLNEEESVIQVDAWMKKIIDSPPFNSLLVVVLTGSHDSFANGACLVKIKKPNMKLKHRKTE